MRVPWTEPAARDLLSTCDYSEQQYGAKRARQTALRISEAVYSLRQFPQIGRLGAKSGTRELVLTALPFLAVCRIREDVVEVLRILHGAQRWP